MKFFLVSNMYPSKKDPGSAIFVKNIEKNLIEENFILSAKAVIKGRSFNKIVQFINYLILYYRILSKGLLCSYDFIYAHNISHTTFGVFILCLLRKKTVIFNIHGTDLKSENIINRLSRRIIELMIRRDAVKSFIVPSQYFKKIVISTFSIESNMVITSPSGGIDGNIFYKKENNTSIKRKEQFILGYVSRIEEKKGWILFVQLIKKLNELNFNCKGIIAGSGPDQEKLKTELKISGLDEKINYLGAVKHNSLSGLYNGMDVFIFPTLYEESLGLVGIEAMACGAIVIGSDIGALTSYIKHEINGYLFKTGDVKDLINTVQIFFNLSKKRKKEIQLNAMQTAYTYEKNIVKKELAQKIRILYEEK